MEFSLCATLYEKNLIHKQNFVLLLSYTYFYLIFGYFQWYHFFCFFNHKSWLTFPNPRTFKFFNPDVVMKFYQISLSNFIIMEIFLMILLSFMESYGTWNLKNFSQLLPCSRGVWIGLVPHLTFLFLRSLKLLVYWCLLSPTSATVWWTERMCGNSTCITII